MKRYQKINRAIYAFEEQMSIEELVGIKEFIDSIIVLRTTYLSKEANLMDTPSLSDIEADKEGSSPKGPEPW